AVSFYMRVVLERLVDDAPIESVQWLQFHDIAPAPHFFGRFHGFFDERIARLGAIAADIYHHFGRRGILLKEQTISDVLQVSKSLTLPPNQAAGIIGFDVQK